MKNIVFVLILISLTHFSNQGQVLDLNPFHGGSKSGTIRIDKYYPLTMKDNILTEATIFALDEWFQNEKSVLDPIFKEKVGPFPSKLFSSIEFRNFVTTGLSSLKLNEIEVREKIVSNNVLHQRYDLNITIPHQEIEYDVNMKTSDGHFYGHVREFTKNLTWSVATEVHLVGNRCIISGLEGFLDVPNFQMQLKLPQAPHAENNKTIIQHYISLLKPDVIKMGGHQLLQDMDYVLCQKLHPDLTSSNNL